MKRCVYPHLDNYIDIDFRWSSSKKNKNKIEGLHNIIQIYDNVLWDWLYSMEYLWNIFHVHFESGKYSMEYY